MAYSGNERPYNGKDNHNRKNGHNNRNNTQVADVLGAGASKLKKKIRDIERLLKKDNIPAHIRVDNERSLKALKVDLVNTQNSLKAKEVAKKYHMVRFFERKKAIRKLKQAMKSFEDVSKTEVRKDIKKARKVVSHSEVDVAYVILFPKEEKYISLYPNAKAGEDQSTLNNAKAKKGAQMTEQRKRELRKNVEKLIETGKLPFSFDDVLAGKTIKVDTSSYSQSTPHQEIDAPNKEHHNNKHGQDKEVEQEEEEDDFFE
ncbi:rRNA-processing protein Efg1p [[Candida] railenensis]|uniref:rRNA-processing protein EFG1 n=1 Tax=[Candida] railenensis TaxID=45579 RepID=A0A9P0QST0_9ASCO|nr:rRNA-processing protein Efg1p [[Candida] railenensis]